MMGTSTIEETGTRNIEFNKLWVGQSISLIGSQVTLLALPITAAVTLGATPLQMGFLSAIGSLPALLFGLLAGVWVDRNKRRPVLIIADIGRALILVTIPLSAVLGMLRVEVLYGVAFIAGALGLFFNVAYRSYLPSLVGKEQLVKANSRLELSNSLAEIIGPGAAGGLIQLIGAPIAIGVDAVSYLLSAFSIGWIRKPEMVIRTVESETNLWSEIKAGLRLVFGEPSLKAIAGCLSSLNLFNSIIEAVLILFLTRQAGLSAGWIGVIFAGGSVGFLLGAVITERVTRAIGLGKGMVLSVLVIGGSDLLIPLAGTLHNLGLLVGALVVAQFLFGLGLTTFQIGQVSLRQSLTPDNLQGRMNATLTTLSWGLVPLGGLMGGGLGQVLGLSLTLVLASLGEILAVLWLVFSPVRMIHQTGIEEI